MARKTVLMVMEIARVNWSNHECVDKLLLYCF